MCNKLNNTLEARPNGWKNDLAIRDSRIYGSRIDAKASINHISSAIIEAVATANVSSFQSPDQFLTVNFNFMSALHLTEVK